jgi:hypothetical protein
MLYYYIMTYYECALPEAALVLASAEAPTDSISVEEIAEYRPFDPADVSVTALTMEEATSDRLFANLTTGLTGISQEVLSRYITNAQVNDLLQAMRERATSVHLLQWEGSCRIPVGVDVAGRTIGNTQWGFVKDDSGEFIGTYERLIDRERITEGTDEHFNAILVFV